MLIYLNYSSMIVLFTRNDHSVNHASYTLKLIFSLYRQKYKNLYSFCYPKLDYLHTCDTKFVLMATVILKYLDFYCNLHVFTEQKSRNFEIFFVNLHANCDRKENKM